jgi:hypothetical protein
MTSYPIPAAAIVPPSPSSLPKAWTLPDAGLAVFHGHPSTPKLFHYFLPALVARSKRVLCLDGANRFDPLLIARFARQRGWDSAIFNAHLRVARAFTCFQLTELFAHVPRVLRKFPADVVIVTAMPDLYFDEDVRDREAVASFHQGLASLKTLAELPLLVAVFSDASSFRTPRQILFQQLTAQANVVWKCMERADGKLNFLQEKSLPPAPRALP